jgi:hypothetical protein
MTHGMTGFLVAVGATSAFCYVLMTQLRNRRTGGGPSRGRSDGDVGSSTDDGGYALTNWSVTHHSAVDGSGNPIDSGSFDSGDSGSGGDGGGSGDGGGGGSD